MVEASRQLNADTTFCLSAGGGGGGSSSGGSGSLLLETILLERSHEGQLVGWGLEATVTHLGRGVDELELDLLQGRALGVLQQGLAQGDDALLGADAAALDHDEVVVDLTVVGEATHGRDALVGQIVLGGGVVLDDLQKQSDTFWIRLLWSCGRGIQDLILCS